LVSRADEGMWLPILIDQNMATMTEMGLKLTAKDIFSINQPSIKDAIVALDHGSCTAELVSGEGLLLTNHHCGYGEIQEHSTVDHDYLTNGFWAMSKKEELANLGKTASFLIRVEEVTNRILSLVPDDSSELYRTQIVDSVSRAIIEEATKGTDYNASVESMFEGNYYYLFVYETFKDIRLVGAPPESVGKYGSDTDNWMWPRHTGDFSMFRVYCSPDGKPADYADENVPFKPKHFLPISLDGVKKGDFTFIIGYPGSTSRYMTSWEVQSEIDITNTNRIKIRGEKQGIWKNDMDKSDKVRIQYASKYARSANYWKYSIGQNKGLLRLNVVAMKQEIEKEFTDWVNQDPTRQKKYGNALALIEQAVKETNPAKSAEQYLSETQLAGAESFMLAFRANGLLNALMTPDSIKLIANQSDKYKERATEFFKDYNAPTDKKSTAAMIKMYMNDVPAQFYPNYINDVIIKKYKGNVDKYVDDLFKKSLFVDQGKMKSFLEKPTAKKLKNDPVFIAANSTVGKLRSFYVMTYESDMKKEEGMRLFEKGLMEMHPNQVFAPDANSTMRLTYGSVGDYNPADAVHYDYYTTLKGVMEKEDGSVREFNVPEKLKEIYNTKDYGSYGNPDGTMNVCFTTNNDITGGNSGSPVMNAKGQLIGLAFDGNWEAMSGDIAFENELQKCICVDIRYVMLIIDKFAGAKNLIDEMTLVKTEPQPMPVEKETAESDM